MAKNTKKISNEEKADGFLQEISDHEETTREEARPDDIGDTLESDHHSDSGVSPDHNEEYEGDVDIGSQKKEIYIYIGPSLPFGKLAQNRIMRGNKNDIYKSLEDVLAEHPQVKHLVVRLDQLAEQK